MGHSRPLFLYFRLFNTYTVDSKQMFNMNKFWPMTGFEPRTSGIGSNRSTNWATQPLPLNPDLSIKHLQVKISDYGKFVYLCVYTVNKNWSTLGPRLKNALSQSKLWYSIWAAHNKMKLWCITHGVDSPMGGIFNSSMPLFDLLSIENSLQYNLFIKNGPCTVSFVFIFGVF